MEDSTICLVPEGESGKEKKVIGSRWLVSVDCRSTPRLHLIFFLCTAANPTSFPSISGQLFRPSYRLLFLQCCPGYSIPLRLLPFSSYRRAGSSRLALISGESSIPRSRHHQSMNYEWNILPATLTSNFPKDFYTLLCQWCRSVQLSRWESEL